MKLLKKQEVSLECVLISAYEYAEENANDQTEKEELFVAVLQEAINHVKNKKAQAV